MSQFGISLKGRNGEEHYRDRVHVGVDLPCTRLTLKSQLATKPYRQPHTCPSALPYPLLRLLPSKHITAAQQTASQFRVFPTGYTQS